MQLILATLYALALSIPVSIGIGFLFYAIAAAVAGLYRRTSGAEGWLFSFLVFALSMWVFTFFVVFAYFARNF